MSAHEFEPNSAWKFEKQSPQNREPFESFKKRMNEKLASQPDDGFSNVRGPIAEAISIPIVPLSEVLTCCEGGFHKAILALRFPNHTFFPAKEIGKLEDYRYPFAVKSDEDFTRGFIVPSEGEIIINPAETIESGDIAVISLDGIIVMKEVTVTPSGFELSSSRGQPPFSVPGEYLLFGRFKILGKVVGVAGPIRKRPENFSI